MKAYKCSQCEHLQDYDDMCGCGIGIDPRIGHREKGDAELCKKNFKLLPKEKHWHAKFSWE